MPAIVSLLLAALLVLAAVCPGAAQIKTVGGDPLMVVTDPAKAVPDKTGPPLRQGQPVRLVEDKGGMARVAVASATPQNGRDILYRLPTAALRTQPGKTHTARPAWLPAPAPAAAADRDVLAFEQDGWLVLVDGTAKPERLERGRYPAVAPDASLVVYSPETRMGVALVDLTAPGRQKRFFPSITPILEKCYSPDGTKLAWRSDTRIELFDPKAAGARPVSVLSGLAADQTLQGFTSDGAALVVQDLKEVTWVGLDGAVLRKEPLARFTDDPWGSSADHYLPSPTDPKLMLVERGVCGTPAFERWADGPGAALYLFEAAGATNFRLTPGNLAAVDPAWAPDGRRVYFAGLPDTPAGGTHRIYRINADGTGLTALDKGLHPSVGSRR